MRIYEGSPRQDWEEVLRSVGAYLDDKGMRGVYALGLQPTTAGPTSPSTPSRN